MLKPLALRYFNGLKQKSEITDDWYFNGLKQKSEITDDWYFNGLKQKSEITDDCTAFFKSLFCVTSVSTRYWYCKCVQKCWNTIWIIGPWIGTCKLLFLWLFYAGCSNTFGIVKITLFGFDLIQSTLVISNSKGLSTILRDTRTSTYQICRIEEKNESNNRI